MGSGRSELYRSTNGHTQFTEGAKAKTYQGDRTRGEYSALARDPARGTKVDYKGAKERAIALDLERQGKIGKVIRDPQAEKGADFIDTSTGQKWDVKSPVSHPKGHTSVRKGAFNVDKMMANVKKNFQEEIRLFSIPGCSRKKIVKLLRMQFTPRDLIAVLFGTTGREIKSNERFT